MKGYIYTNNLSLLFTKQFLAFLFVIGFCVFNYYAVRLATLIYRKLEPRLKSSLVFTRAWIGSQIDPLSTGRLISTFLFIFIVFVLMTLFLNAAHSATSIAIALLIYAVTILATLLSLLVRVPILRKIITAPEWRWLIWASPVLTYMAALMAQSAVESIILAPASNAPTALLGATIIILAIIASVPLLLVTLVVEILFLFMFFQNERSFREKSLFLLYAMLFTALYSTSLGILNLGGKELAHIVLSELLLEYDAAPIAHCKIPAEVDAKEVKGIYLRGTIGRVLLVAPGPSARNPFVLRELTAEKAEGYYVAVRGLAQCFDP